MTTQATFHAGGVATVATRVEIRDSRNRPVARVPGPIRNGKVELNVHAAIKQTFRFSARDTDRWLRPFTTMLAPFVTITDLNGKVSHYQCGLYVTVPPDESHTPTGTTSEIEARDLTYYAATRAPSYRPTFTAGQNIAATIRGILQTVGITAASYSVPTDTRTFDKDLSIWPAGTPWLTIANHLCGMLGWYTLTPSLPSGRLITMPYMDMQVTQPHAIYRDGDGSSVFSPFGTKPILTTLANHIVVTRDDTDPAKRFSHTESNTDPRSPSSIPNIGRLSRSVFDSQLTDLAAAKAKARQLMQEWGSLQVNAEMITALEPWHQPYEIYDLAFTRRDGTAIEEATGKFRCSGWSMDLGVNVKAMRHSLNRIVEYGSMV